MYEGAHRFSSSRCAKVPQGCRAGIRTQEAGAQTNELLYATPQYDICYTFFRKESVEGQDLPGSAAYQDQLLEATALLLRTRDVRAKSADLENKGIGVTGFFRLL